MRPTEYRYVTHCDCVVRVCPDDFPSLVEVAQVLAGAIVTTVDASLAELGEERMPLDLGIGRGQQSGEVAPAQRLQDLISQLESVLRHRPRSISRWRVYVEPEKRSGPSGRGDDPPQPMWGSPAFRYYPRR